MSGSNWLTSRLLEVIFREDEKGKVACRSIDLPLTGVNPRTVCFFATPLRAVVTAARFPRHDNGTFLDLATFRRSSAEMQDMISSNPRLPSSFARIVIGRGGFGVREKSSLKSECIEFPATFEVDELEELPDTDRLVAGRSGGGVEMTAPLSFTSTRPSRATQSDSRIASASSGSAFSSAADNPVSRWDHGLVGPESRCLRGLADLGVGYGFKVGVEGPAMGSGGSRSESETSAGNGSGMERARMARFTPSSPSSEEYAMTREGNGWILPGLRRSSCVSR